MKRQLFIAAALTGTLALAGCDQADDSEQNAADTATQTEQTTGSEQASQNDEQQASKTLEGVLEFVATDTPLPDDAQVTVSLLDVARADAPATTISETTVDVTGNDPVEFGLDYTTDQVDPGHAHAVRAEIRDDEGNLLWTTTQRHQVEVGPDAEQAPITVSLEPVASQGSIAGQALEDTENAVDQAGDAVADTTGDAMDAAGDAADATQDAAGDAVDTTQDAAGDAAEATEETAEDAAAATEAAAEEAHEEVEEMMEDDTQSTQ
ncbi:YbaY family lipoprotein [Halomonas sp. HG01]|uniref:YbaY family lipoprotein n=1 Tax=Halomonas sp. HG01 TaxID=1609967 RepID=UPI000695F079|nr:YbaY family lipoprotein [Halomonas sp. HG01]